MLVFISYAHGDIEAATPDRDWVTRIQTHLKPAAREDIVELWWDESIRPGDAWEEVIATKLDQADVAILLVSPRFLASDYIYHKEMPRLLTRRDEEDLVVIPIILETSDPQATFNYPDPKRGPEKLSITSLQAANDPSAPLAALKDSETENQIFVSLAARLREIAASNPRPKPNSEKTSARNGLLRVIVAGTGIPDELSDEQRGTAHALGVRLAEDGFGLISGGWEGVDDIVTAAFIAEHERVGSSPDEFLLQVVQSGWQPLHKRGEIMYVESGDSEWVEQIVRANAIVLIGGLGGTWTSGELGYMYGKPVLPLADAGQDAKEFYDFSLKRWDEYPMPKISKSEFEELSRPIPVVLENVMEILRRIRSEN